MSQAGVKLGPAQVEQSSGMGQSWPGNTGFPRACPPPHYSTLHQDGS